MFLGGESQYYQNIYLEENQTDYCKIYRADNKKINQTVFLKVIDKNELKSGNYNYLLKKVEREENINKKLKEDINNKFYMENILNFYRKIENSKYIIFEIEYCKTNLKKYLSEKGPLQKNENLFKYIILSVAKALFVIHNKGIMHRDIKPNNIFLKTDIYGNKIIKLGNFSSSIFIKDNHSESIGTIYYASPEIIKNLKYDERCDLWSLGVTLYELYFRELPYGKDVNVFDIKNALYRSNFIFKKTRNPNLDIFFKRLLVRTLKNRMTFNEFFNYVFNKDFMNKNVIYINNNLNYSKIYEMILKEQQILDKPATLVKKNSDSFEQEAFDIEETLTKNIEKIVTFVEGEHFPDISNIPLEPKYGTKKYNNIIYYDENKTFVSSIIEESYLFESYTSGAFILCKDIESLKLIKNEIINENKNDERIKFNLISSGSSFENIMNFLEKNQDLKSLIKNAIIYSINLNKYLHLKSQYSQILRGITEKRDDIKSFINEYSSEYIKPFPMMTLITYKSYQEIYKDRHFKISQFYGKLTKESFKKYYEKMRDIIGNDKSVKEGKKNFIYKSFELFDLNKDVENINELLVKSFSDNTFCGDLNKWNMDLNFEDYEPIAYFTARLMYSLNYYAKKYTKFCNEDIQLYRGIKIPYTTLILYERAKGKIICLSNFNSTTYNINYAKKMAEIRTSKELYETNLKFSVIMKINNICNEEWISSGINIQEVSKYKDEREVVFQPFTFYFVNDVKVNIQDYTAEIHLQTIGKKEILEDNLKDKKDIFYNRLENIIQIKNI